MEDEEREIRVPGKSNVKIVKWKVRKESKISKGILLGLYEAEEGPSAGKQLRLKASNNAVVTSVLVDEGKTASPGDVLLKIRLCAAEPCSHPTIMKDMCAECGADLRSEFGLPGDLKESVKKITASVAMVHSIPELRVSEQEALEIGKEDENRLLVNRKLVLLVDLDQTLIHTTNDTIPAKLKDVFHFQLRHGPGVMWYHTKLRPNTAHFLETISKLFELHICTFGNRMYAHTIAKFLDPDGRYFSHRILSRDECFDGSCKTANLKSLFPCGDSMVCIIDDREDVWENCPNLIHVRAYRFFQGTADINAPPGLTKTENDDIPLVHRVRRTSQTDTTAEDKDSAASGDLKNNMDCKQKGGEESVSVTMETTQGVEVIGKDSDSIISIETSPAGESIGKESDSVVSAETAQAVEVKEKESACAVSMETSQGVEVEKKDSDSPVAMETTQDMAVIVKESNSTVSMETTRDMAVIEKESNSTVSMGASQTGVSADHEENEKTVENEAKILSNSPSSNDYEKSLDTNTSDISNLSVDENEKNEDLKQQDKKISTENETEEVAMETEDNKMGKERKDEVTIEEGANEQIKGENVKSENKYEETELKEKKIETENEEKGEQMELEGEKDEENVKKNVQISEEEKINTQNEGKDEHTKNIKYSDTSETAKAKCKETGEEEEIEWEDEDDYLWHLEEILTRIHKAYYDIYNQMKTKKNQTMSLPSIKDVISYVRRKVLKGVNIVFSGVVPLHKDPEKSRIYLVARSLGATIHTSLVPRTKNSKTEATTHVVAAKLGTIKVKQAQRMKGVLIINPDWLWSCSERWEKVEEILFPVNEATEDSPNPENAKPNKQKKKTPRKRKVPDNDGEQNSNKLKKPKTNSDETIEADNDEVLKDDVDKSSERDDALFANTYNPLFVFSDADIESMDKEVDEEMGESGSDSDEDDEERNERVRQRVLGDVSDSSDDSLTGDFPLGWKVKKPRSESPSGESEDENKEKNNTGYESENDVMIKYEGIVDAFGPHRSSESERSDDSIGSVDDEIADAVEKEFLGAL